jgi:hypothetical protein
MIFPHAAACQGYHHAHATFRPGSLSVIYGAFDDAMRSLGETTTEANRDTVRTAVGKAVIDLAMVGRMERRQLANYAAYRARMVVDLLPSQDGNALPT